MYKAPFWLGRRLQGTFQKKIHAVGFMGYNKLGVLRETNI